MKCTAYYPIVFLAALAISTAGCDLINPPNKSQKTPAEEPTGTDAAVTANATEEAPKLAKNVLVSVGNWTLTTEQFNQRLKLLKEGMPDFDPDKPGNKEAVLNELIRQQLLVKDAEDSGIGSQKEIKEAVDDFRRTLLVQELANRMTKDIAATEKEAQEYYEQNKQLFVVPVQWKVREIVVADEATAKNILVQLLQGGDFAVIAKSQSKGKTASSGGELKAFAKAPFAAMQNAIASLDAGGASSVFKGPDGYYIVRVDEKKGGEAKSFIEVKADLIAGLTLRKQQEKILKRIDELAEKYKVNVNKEILGAATNGK